MKKKVFLVINSLNGGGAEHAAQRLSKEWVKKYDLTVISLMPLSKDDYDFSGEILSINEKYKGFTWLNKIKNASKEIDRLAKAKKPDAIVSFLQNANLCVALTKYKTKKVLSIRNYLGKQYGGIKKICWGFLIKRYFNRADYIVSVSELINKEMETEYKIDKQKCICINNMYDTELIKKLSNEKMDSEAELFYRDSIVLSNMGHVSKQKGQHHLIRIMPELIKRNNKIKIVIVGDTNSSFYKNLQSIIAKKNINDKVLFTGKVKNPYKYIKNSECFIFTSLYEGFPNAIVEAMSCGVPVISADCKSGPAEILKTKIEEYGILVGDDQSLYFGDEPLTRQEMELANIIIELISNKEIKEKLKRKSIERAEDYSIKNIIKEWDKII